MAQPFVSVCTPTYNRRVFIPSLIECFKAQTYPKDLMEWIVIDDGEDKVEDLFDGVQCVKYFGCSEKLKLGRKRNLMHEKCRGDIIVYMDDDDFYPPQRVSHALRRLRSHPKALCAGSSALYIYFNDLKKTYQFGPYGNSHATAATFAFRKELLDVTNYDDNAEVSEERHFLKNYTIPFVQLSPSKTILSFAHQHNTFDKKQLLENPDQKFVKEIHISPVSFIKNRKLADFYTSA